MGIIHKQGLRVLPCGMNFNNFLDVLDHYGNELSDKNAINFLKNGEVDPDSQISLTYGKLIQQANAIASELIQQYPRNSRILLLCPAGIEFVLSFIACLYAGMIAVPCSLPSKRDSDWKRIYSILDDANPCAVVTIDTYFSDYVAKFNSSKCEVINLSSIDLSGKKHVENIAISPYDIAFLQYTSGSTGSPKGVMVSHSNLMHNQGVLHIGTRYSSESCCVSWLPLFHDMGLIGCLLQSLYQGCTFNFMAPAAFLQKPIRWLNAISHFKGTIAGAPNFAFDLCVNSIKDEQLSSLDLSSWQCASNGAEPIKAKTIERFNKKFSICGLKSTTLSPCFGLAEGTLMVTCQDNLTETTVRHLDYRQLEQNKVVDLHPADPDSRAYVGVGCIVGDQVLRIVSPDTLTLCSAQQVGEIWVKGDSIAQGYWQKPEATKQTFRAFIADTKEGPFLRTGDAGFVDENGQLFISGRLKDMMVLHGRNIFPQDIEQLVEECSPTLNPVSSAAFSLIIEGEERLVVVQEVTRSEVRKIDSDHIIKKIRRTIMMNSQVNIYDVLLLRPGGLLRTTSGKVQRRRNKLAYSAGNLKKIASLRKPELATS
jgi:acyl-CoA synthetase (AMP-forming)/AMP-acid ligase II